MDMGGLEALASKQWGVFSLAQARAHGINSSDLKVRRAAGIIERVHPGVYRFTSAPREFRQLLKAAELWGGEGALISHWFAARLWDWSFESRRYRGQLWTPDVTVPASRHGAAEGVIVHRSLWLPGEHYRVKDSIAVTSPFRTLIDLAPFLSQRQLETAMGSAFRIGHFSRDQLNDRLSEAPADRLGVRIVTGQLPLASDRTDSPFEDLLLAAIVRARLPRPIEGHPVVTRAGTYHPDFCYPHRRLVIEAQSVEHHTKRSVFIADQKRFRNLNAAGWAVFQVVFEEVRVNEAGLMSELREVLAGGRRPRPLTTGHQLLLAV